MLSCFVVLLPKSALANLILTNTFDDKSYDNIERQYQSHQCSQTSDYLDNSLFKFVTSPVRGGKFAMQHHIKNCDERSEIEIPDGFFKENQQYWLGWSYFFPNGFLKPVSGRPDYSIIHQMFYQASSRDQRSGVTLFECNPKSTKGGKLTTKGAPGSHMTISPQGDKFNFTVTYYKGKDSEGRYIFGCKNFSMPAKLNKWEDFVMNFKPSSNSEQGFVKVWLNGKLYINEKVALLRPGVKAMGNWKIGGYVGDPGNGERLFYTDELKVGDQSSSLEEVSPK
ncbi:MAG: heparin lyase I family protein [Waterburya sp.]